MDTLFQFALFLHMKYYSISSKYPYTPSFHRRSRDIT